MLKTRAIELLAGITPREKRQADAPTNLHVISGEVGETSENGKALVRIDGLVFGPGDSQYVEIDTIGGLQEGDTATVLLTGENGHGMTPLAIGSIGSIDRIVEKQEDLGINVEEANNNASEALQTALDGAFLVLTSTNGQLFKNGSESTILQVALFPNGGSRCDTIEQVRDRFGSTAYIEWKWMHESDGTWGTLVSTDPHISQGGMWLTVGPDDVATKTTFSASLIVPD